jgi:nitroreductase
MTQQEPLAMPLEEAMRTQRAIRRIKSDPVDDSLVLHILELAMKAPTGSNAQNWEFIVVKDREVIAKLGRLNRRAINLAGPIYKRSIERRGDEKMLGIQKAVQWQADHFDEIPVVVVTCLKGVIPPWPSVLTSSAYGSIYPAVQNLLLAARAAGLGAALITAPLWSKLLARRALGLPWNVTPCALIPLGWPIGKYGPTTRRPVGELVSLDKYGNRAFL